MEIILYGIAFFVATIIIQYILHKMGKIKSFWAGSTAIVSMCVLGIYFHSVNYLAAIIGFIIADEIGKKLGWH